ncbi:MAG: NAD(P)-dependent oxidoreductase [Verrucomicrobia bacterium]|nr:NAD(P)-dependent oxidoreductase [Verrucomicrobiota bacterium]
MSSPTGDSPALGLIGLGLLGSALAERLLAGGFRVIGWDLDAARREAFARSGGHVAGGAGEVFSAPTRLMLSLPSHREVNALLRDHAAAVHPGLTVIDTTTGDPDSSAALAAELARRGCVYLDATVSGSSAQVREGTAVLMVGGDAAAFAACADIFSQLGCQAFHTGPAGSGAKMKLVTNTVLGLNRAALAEGLALARGLGLDAAQALAVMRGGPAYSRIMDRKGEKMLHSEFSPEARLSQHLKDVRLIVEHGRAAGLPMPLSATHRAILEQAEAAGLGALDNSAIIQVLGRAKP